MSSQILGDIYEGIGNKYSVMIIAFLSGFLLGTTKIKSTKTPLFGTLFGLLFAIVFGVIAFFIDKYVKKITITVNFNFLLTILLFALFIFLVSSESKVDRVVQGLTSRF